MYEQCHTFEQLLCDEKGIDTEHIVNFHSLPLHVELQQLEVKQEAVVSHQNDRLEGVRAAGVNKCGKRQGCCPCTAAATKSEERMLGLTGQYAKITASGAVKRFLAECAAFHPQGNTVTISL